MRKGETMKLKPILLILAALLLPHFAMADTAVMSEQFLFDTDKADIKAADRAKLEAAAALLKGENVKATIVGHTDKRASRLYNLALGERRANAVRQALIDLGVNPEVLVVTVSYGKEKAAAPNDDLPEHLAANRRVELTVIRVEPMVREVLVPRNEKKNRISLSGGIAPRGLDKDVMGAGLTKITQDYESSFGLTYQRKVSDRFSVGATAFTSNSYYLNLGFDF